MPARTRFSASCRPWVPAFWQPALRAWPLHVAWPWRRGQASLPELPCGPAWHAPSPALPSRRALREPSRRAWLHAQALQDAPVSPAQALAFLAAGCGRSYLCSFPAFGGSGFPFTAGSRWLSGAQLALRLAYRLLPRLSLPVGASGLVRGCLARAWAPAAACRGPCAPALHLHRLRIQLSSDSASSSSPSSSSRSSPLGRFRPRSISSSSPPPMSSRSSSSAPSSASSSSSKDFLLDLLNVALGARPLDGDLRRRSGRRMRLEKCLDLFGRVQAAVDQLQENLVDDLFVCRQVPA